MYDSHLLLQVISGHVLELNLLCAIDVSSIGENADGETRAGEMGEPKRKELLARIDF